ncbi:hypothetical protein BSL78_29829 [Apostichopus japonicus]|uniref:Uncharacterized protein n=1 Tax=Stichopus japonicus TaxID=307972 RepID=A0A2G8JC85_STIJA|nr:hypothetical protein BSL78_29829 [Apostichopus japonicus]
MTGSGSILVQGGDGGQQEGGGGSGGRISVYLESPKAFTGKVVVRGGDGGPGSQPGGSGTAYWQESINGVVASNLYVDNRGALPEFPQVTLVNETSSRHHFEELHLLGSSHLKFVGDVVVLIDRLVSGTGSTITIHDGMALSVNEGFTEHTFYCSFKLSPDGELRLPARATFLGDANSFSGNLTNLQDLVVAPYKSLVLSPLARTALFVDGSYQFSSPRGAYKLSSITLQHHATLILSEGYQTEEPLAISLLELDYGSIMTAYNLMISGSDMVLNPGSTLNLQVVDTDQERDADTGTGAGYGGFGGSSSGITAGYPYGNYTAALTPVVGEVKGHQEFQEEVVDC